MKWIRSKLWAVALVATGVAGCASAPRMEDAYPAPAEDEAVRTDAPQHLEDARQEVESLLLQIEARRGGRVAGPEAGQGTAATPDPDETPQTPNVQGRCATVCQSSDAICASSTRICTIAERFANDAYFTDKCTWSQKACNDAGAECVQCNR